MKETGPNNMPNKYFLHLFIVASIPVLFIWMWEVGRNDRKGLGKCTGRGTEQCESAVIQRLESTGSMRLGIRYEGNGVFTGYATKYGSGPTFKWSMKTDCNCEIINSNTDLIK